MRSTTDEELPLGLPEPRRGARRSRPRGTDGRLSYRLGSDALASHGLPAGTELVIDPQRPPRRGHVLFVRVDGRLRVGVFDVQLGRAVLRWDHGSLWLDHTVEVWGVATEADAPLEGMPRLRPPAGGASGAS